MLTYIYNLLIILFSSAVYIVLEKPVFLNSHLQKQIKTRLDCVKSVTKRMKFYLIILDLTRSASGA